MRSAMSASLASSGALPQPPFARLLWDDARPFKSDAVPDAAGSPAGAASEVQDIGRPQDADQRGGRAEHGGDHHQRYGADQRADREEDAVALDQRQAEQSAGEGGQ